METSGLYFFKGDIMFWIMLTVIIFSVFLVGYVILACQFVDLVKENRQLRKEREENKHHSERKDRDIDV